MGFSRSLLGFEKNQNNSRISPMKTSIAEPGNDYVEGFKAGLEASKQLEKAYTSSPNLPSRKEPSNLAGSLSGYPSTEHLTQQGNDNDIPDGEDNSAWQDLYKDAGITGEAGKKFIEEVYKPLLKDKKDGKISTEEFNTIIYIAIELFRQENGADNKQSSTDLEPDLAPSPDATESSSSDVLKSLPSKPQAIGKKWV